MSSSFQCPRSNAACTCPTSNTSTAATTLLREPPSYSWQVSIRLLSGIGSLGSSCDSGHKRPSRHFPTLAGSCKGPQTCAAIHRTCALQGVHSACARRAPAVYLLCQCMRTVASSPRLEPRSARCKDVDDQQWTMDGMHAWGKAPATDHIRAAVLVRPLEFPGRHT